MRKTIKELVDMIDKGEIITEHSTQRAFIYRDIKTLTDQDGEITKAGNVIRSILHHRIQLPSLHFWKKSDKIYNLHDGKQRLLSIYEFSKNRLDTFINNTNVRWSGLTDEEKSFFENYTFDIVVSEGDQTLEETSFRLINSSAEPLTDYETTRGLFYGLFLNDFEKFYIALSPHVQFLGSLGRGQIALQILYSYFNLLESNAPLLQLGNHLRTLRRKSFDDRDFKEELEIVSEVYNLVRGIKLKTALIIGKEIYTKKLDKNAIIKLYRDALDNRNDIKNWKVETHLLFVRRFTFDSLVLDGQRFFDKTTKDMLYETSPRCACVGCRESSYSKLEVDHIVPWSKGGLTNINNAQLLCKTHNTSKKDKDELVIYR